MNHLKLIEDNEKCEKILSIYSSIFRTYLDNSKLTKFYGGQPISLMPESIIHITEKRISDNEFLYNVTPKLDGVRMLLLLHPLINGNVVFIDRSMKFFEPILPYLYTYNSICLFDGELYENVFLSLICCILTDSYAIIY